MAVNLFLISLMSFIIYFFVLSMNNFSIYSILYSAFLIYLYGRMTFAKRERKSTYRKIFQVVFAFLFCIAFIADLYAERGSMAITSNASSNGEIPFCHIAIPQVLTPLLITRNIIFPARLMNHYASIGSMFLICLVVMLTIGRGWCSWVCFYGGWEEGFSSMGKKRRLNLLSKNKELREFQLGFLFFIVLASLGELAAVYCKWFCPFKLVTEYSPMNSIPSLIAGVIFIGLFLALVVILPVMTKRRVQCGTLCPFGAFASLTDKLSTFRIRIDTDKCKGCMKCASTCKFGAIDIATIQEKKGRPEMNCAKCGDCIGVCSEKAISFAFKFSKKQSCHCSENLKSTKPSATRRFIKGLTNPENLFRFASFTFGVIMSSGFAITALNKIAGVFIK